MLRGINLTKKEYIYYYYEAYIKEKAIGKPLKTIRAILNNLIEEIYIDLYRPIALIALGGFNYFAQYTCGKYGGTQAKGLRNKDNFYLVFKKQKIIIEKQTRRSIKRLISNYRGEFDNNKIKELYKECSILQELSALYVYQQNRKAERGNRTIINKVRTILADANLPKFLQLVIVLTVVYLYNRSPIARLRL